jgi:hypothetical protein
VVSSSSDWLSRGGVTDAGVVDENVEPTEAVRDHGREGLAMVRGGDVADAGNAAGPRHELFEAILSPCRYHDLGASLAQGLGESLPEAGGGRR